LVDAGRNFAPAPCPPACFAHAAWARNRTRAPRRADDTFVTVVGNLTGDPELRFTPGGHAVANFRLAVTPRVREGDQWKDGDTSFFRVNAWRGLAENLTETLTKGTRVIVTGKLRNRSWETDGGEQRTVTEIEADELGPSLKFTTAKVERANRGGAGDKGE